MLSISDKLINFTLLFFTKIVVEPISFENLAAGYLLFRHLGFIHISSNLFL